MKTKHFFLSILAAVCCLSLFTACGSNDDPETEPDYNRAYVAMNFSFQLTEDMLKYCYVELSISNGKGEPTSKVINADDLDNGYCYAQLTSAFPAIFTLDREVTLKPDVDLSKIESIKYSTGYQYETGYFNAALSAVYYAVLRRIGNRRVRVVPNIRYHFVQSFCFGDPVGYDRLGLAFLRERYSQRIGL